MPRLEPSPPAEPSTADKVAFLAEPAAYPHAPRCVEVRETHMSWVFLAGERVFKLKKPVRYDAPDFSTLARRAHFVAEEVRLNRRLAPRVYLGARELRAAPGGRLTLGRGGRIVDWLVEMVRLPETRMLDRALLSGRATRDDVASVARLLCGFYSAMAGERLAPEVRARRVRDQHRQTARVLSDPRLAFDGERVARVLDRFEAAFEAARPDLDARVRAGRILEGHGDLRPEHVCLGAPPVVIDCLEFSRDLRLVDPFDEIVYLGLECARLGADWVFPELRARLEDGLDDRPPEALLAVYWRYRALLRARLALRHLMEPEPRSPAKWRLLAWSYVRLAEEAEARVARRSGR